MPKSAAELSKEYAKVMEVFEISEAYASECGWWVDLFERLIDDIVSAKYEATKIQKKQVDDEYTKEFQRKLREAKLVYKAASKLSGQQGKVAESIRKKWDKALERERLAKLKAVA